MAGNGLKLISGKLDQLIRLQTAALIEGKKQNDQLALLSMAGFQPRMIAEILGTTPNTVRVQLSKLRKRNRSKGRRQ